MFLNMRFSASVLRSGSSHNCCDRLLSCPPSREMIIDLISSEHSLHAGKALRGLVGHEGIGKGTRATWESSFFQTNGCAAAEAVICEEAMHNVNHLRT